MAARRRSPLALAAAAAATAPLLALAQPSASQVWINWGYGPSEAVVSWSAPDASLSTNVTELWAQWAYDEASVAGGAGIETAYAALARYATPPGGKGIFGTLPGYVSSVFYRVTLAGVATARRVFVRVGSAAAGWSRVYSFTSHPGVGANVPVRLLVLADLEVDCYVEATGKVCNPSAVRAAVTTPARDWRGMDSINAGAVILGDLSYANGNQSHWDFWHSTFSEEVASKLAVMSNAGNHEEEKGVGMDAFLSFKTRWGGMPFDSPANVATGALFYSYEVGGVHVIALSAYEDLSATSPQTVFLLNDLAAVNRTRTPWLVCVWHPPVYNSNTKHYEQHESFRLAYEQLFVSARVNVILNGHVHGYERTRMVNNNTLVNPATGGGIYYFTLGFGGKELYQTWLPFDQLRTNFSAARSSAFWGFGVLSAPNATHMTIEAFCAAYDGYSEDLGANCSPGQLVDTFTFENQLIANPLGPAATTTPTPTPTAAPGAAAASADQGALNRALGSGVGIGIGALAAVALVGAVMVSFSRSRRSSSGVSKLSASHANVRDYGAAR